MNEIWFFQLEMLMRILLAGICGVVIGYERKNRNKEAGIRTHMIVALGAALIMIVSKYGFDDLLGDQGIALDPSRIAAQIVTGVGFLGAGMIFMRKNMISGLTTAAGIWATSGIGMAIGSGLYMIGIASGVLIVLVQLLLHTKWIHEPIKDEINFTLIKNKANITLLQQALKNYQIEITTMKITEVDATYEVVLGVSFPEGFQTSTLSELFEQTSFIKAMDV